MASTENRVVHGSARYGYLGCPCDVTGIAAAVDPAELSAFDYDIGFVDRIVVFSSSPDVTYAGQGVAVVGVCRRAAIDRLVECQIVAVGINGAHVQFDAFEGKGGLQFEVAGICQRFSVACYDTGFWRCACSCFVV